MKEQKIRFTPIPSTAEVEAERERLAYRSRYMRVLRSTVYTLLVVAAVAVLLATLFLPVLQVSGDSMEPHSAGPGHHSAGQGQRHEDRRPLRILLAEQASAQAHHRPAR